MSGGSPSWCRDRRDLVGTKVTRLAGMLWSQESGQDLTEYGLLLVFLTFSAVLAMNSLAAGIGAAFSKAAVSLHTAT